MDDSQLLKIQQCRVQIRHGQPMRGLFPQRLTLKGFRIAGLNPAIFHVVFRDRRVVFFCRSNSWGRSGRRLSLAGDTRRVLRRPRAALGDPLAEVRLCDPLAEPRLGNRDLVQAGRASLGKSFAKLSPGDWYPG